MELSVTVAVVTLHSKKNNLTEKKLKFNYFRKRRDDSEDIFISNKISTAFN